MKKILLLLILVFCIQCTDESGGAFHEPEDLDFETDTYTNPDTYSDTNPDTYSDTNLDTYSDTNPDTYSDTNPDTYSDTNPDTYSDTNPDTYSDTETEVEDTGIECNPTAITPYVRVNSGAWQQVSSVSVEAGGTLEIGPQPVSGGSWSWTGQGGFTATTRAVTITNIQTNQAGTYTATHTNACGAVTTHAFTIIISSTDPGRFTITLNQDYTGAPGNMIVQTDAYGNLTGDSYAPLILPSPTRSGFDFRGWFTTSAATGGTRVLSGANGTKFTGNTTIYARWTPQTRRTLSDIPTLEKEIFDWVKDVRNVCEPVIRGTGVSGGNLIFHQLYAGGGSINWAVRWESNQTVTLQQRQRIAAMLYDGINDWIRPLMGYEDFPFGEIPVSVVGWAVQDENLILDRQPNEIIWVNSTHEAPMSGYTTGFMASAPRNSSRFLNYNAINNTSGGHINYIWPQEIGGRNGRFDMYLWLTHNKEGGNGSAEGGDWGYRWGNQGTNGAAVSAADAHNNSGTINGVMLHEIGHGFGFYDWYGGPCCGCEMRNPPAYGTQSRTIMHWVYHTNTSGNPGLNQFDQWQIRYYYNWVRDTSLANRWNYSPVEWVPSGQ